MAGASRAKGTQVSRARAGLKKRHSAAPGGGTRAKIRLALGYFLALVAYFLLIFLFGFGIATACFVFLFLFGWVKTRWTYALIYTATLLGAAEFMGWMLDLRWPEALLGWW